ncbi:MAG: hypothetical protein CSA39_06900 [Flavobacteriales bacterium]|nr:MAG: hypothetical protein CSA39_06900 [Flavobacteriales bacterium]
MIKQNKYKTTGFQIPKGYFSDFQKNIAKKTKAIHKQKATGFSVSADYFSTLDDAILNKITKKKTANKLLKLNGISIKKWMAVAATVLILITLWFTIDKKQTTEWNNISSTEVELWVTEDLIEFDTYQIFEAYPEIDLSDTDIFKDENVLDYLSNKDVELLLLNN